MSPTRRAAWVFAAIALVAIVVPVPVALLAVLALLCVVAVDALSVRKPVEVVRTTSPVVSGVIASPVVVELAAPVPGSVLIRQPAPESFALTPDEEPARLDARVVPRKRGRYELGAPVVRRIGPLGMGRWDRKTPLEPVSLSVFPDLVNARRLVMRVRHGRFGSAGRQARGPLGLGTEFELIREYAPDDDIRQVNWLATARTGRPMSNQYRVEQDRDLVCLLDCGRLMAAPVGDRTRLDVALDVMTALGLVADELGDRFGVVAFSGAVERSLAPRRNGGEAAVRTCFDLEASGVDSDFEAAFQSVGRAKRAMVVVVTDLLDEAAAVTLLDAAPVLTRRHAVVVASVRDPAITGIMRREPANAVDAYEAVVAASVTAARDRAVARLRGAGASVVEASPDALPAACVDAYLSLKARARL
jgi:uncharacterized protein (DUF58 family)